MFTIIITLALFGLLVWAINQFIPMDGRFKNLINIVAIILVILYLLNVFWLS